MHENEITFLDGILSKDVDERARRSLLDFIEKNKLKLSPVWHPLGFIHVKLAEAPNGDTFRLHLWLPDVRHPEEQSAKIHDHRFDIHSVVLAGSIINVNYKFVESGSGAYRSVSIEYQDGGSAKLSETGGYGDALEISRESVAVLGQYRVSKQCFHESVASTSHATLTLVRTSNLISYKPRALFPRSLRLPLVRKPIPCDTNYWLSNVKLALLS